jgi:hypothetical protein
MKEVETFASSASCFMVSFACNLVYANKVIDFAYVCSDIASFVSLNRRMIFREAVFCEQVRAAVTRSRQRRRVAIVIADNLRTHTPSGSLLVRSMVTELQEHLQLVYTPAYDPDANRIEWLWRISRRVVTHNHHRGTFELLLADVEQHFQVLAQAPREILRHIGSPIAASRRIKTLLCHSLRPHKRPCKNEWWTTSITRLKRNEMARTLP